MSLKSEQLLTGKEFNKLNIPLYKLLNDNLIHYGFKYDKGLNVLKEEWNPSGNGRSGDYIVLLIMHFGCIDIIKLQI